MSAWPAPRAFRLATYMASCVAKSELGYKKSRIAASENITKSQHCRAEVYIDRYGWIPVDPADVRKVVLEEPPGNRTLRRNEMV